MQAGKVALLTGATGFLGVHLVHRLLLEGVEVRALTSGTSKDRLGRSSSRVIWFDTDESSIQRATVGVDLFFNLAVLYDRPSYSTTEIDTVNVALPLNIIAALSRNERTVTCILGDSFYRKFPAGATAQPRYTASKSQLYSRLQALHDFGRCRVALLLIEQVYGPGENINKAYPHVVSQMLKNASRIPLTQGIQERDFIDVDDVIDAMLAVAGAQFVGCLEVGCGSGKSTPVREVFEHLKILTGSSSELGFGDIPSDQDILKSTANTAWLHNEGWNCKVSLEAGLRKFVTDIDTRLKLQAA